MVLMLDLERTTARNSLQVIADVARRLGMIGNRPRWGARRRAELSRPNNTVKSSRTNHKLLLILAESQGLAISMRKFEEGHTSG